MKRFANPLIKRVPRELKDEFGKYFVILALLVGMIGMVSGSVQALTGAFMLSPSMMGAGLLNTVQAKQPKFKSIGSTGGLAGNVGTWRLYTMCTRIAEEDLNDVGRPLCEIRRPAEIPGFIMVRNGDMILPDGTSGEHAEIKAYLENGFFYE